MPDISTAHPGSLIMRTSQFKIGGGDSSLMTHPESTMNLHNNHLNVSLDAETHSGSQNFK